VATVRAGTDVVEHEVRVEAPPETVFDYFTDPTRIVRWMGTDATLDPRPGGICRVTINGVAMSGQYTEVAPPSRVAFRWGFETELLNVPPSSTLVEVDLTPDGDGTIVRLTHTRLPEEAVEFHRNGWDHFMPRLVEAAGGRDPGHDPWESGAGPPVLWHLKVSHYNEKARWALDFKRVPHLRRAVDAGFHRQVARKLTSGSTFPILELEGRAIGDSTRIIEELERRYPDPPLYPAEAEARRRALELEDFFDEELGPYTRRLVINHVLPDGDLLGRIFAPDMPPARRLLARAMYPRIRRQLRKDFEIDELGVEHAYQKVRAAGERFQVELRPSGYLVGAGFTVADLTLAALVAPAIAPEQFPYEQPQRGHPLLEPLRAAIDESGLGDWAREMYARHRPVSAEVPISA
jgi:glutathione S-transferase